MYTVTNIDNVTKTFTSETDLINYARRIFDENESDPIESVVKPKTIAECETYLVEHCPNLTLQLTID